MKKIAFYTLAFLVLTSCNKNPEIQTPLENSGFKQLSTSGQTSDFLNQLPGLNPNIHLEKIGNSCQNKPIWMTKISNNQDNPKKIKILILAQQHGNEPSGKEGALLFLKDFALGKNSEMLASADLFIIPMLNPDGADQNQRRNGNNTDLNRDHLLLLSPENQALHRIFDSLQPEVTIDVHEYYPYDSAWYAFGFLKQWDIQLGGLTNPNTFEQHRMYQQDTIIPFVGSVLKENKYSFLEYPLGSLAHGERLRRSTTDVNDGRQSFGIQGTLSFIIEGLNGKNATENIERRSKSQKLTLEVLTGFCAKNHAKILNMVQLARNHTIYLGKKAELRPEHYKGKAALSYPLTSVATAKDSIFMVEEYHNLIKSDISTILPKGYLVPKEDSLLVAFTQRNHFAPKPLPKNCKIFQYFIHAVDTIEIEEYPCLDPMFTKTEVKSIRTEDYHYFETNTLKGLILALALEPQSSVGLVNYAQFNGLLQADKPYPVLRVE